jgi:hypothetical protein
MDISERRSQVGRASGIIQEVNVWATMRERCADVKRSGLKDFA